MTRAYPATRGFQATKIKNGSPSQEPGVPSGDSPYVKAKHAQLVDKDLSKAIPLFWTAINSGDHIASALKDMAVVMKQMDRPEEGIEAIKSFRHLCLPSTQSSIDNVLLDLYKKCGGLDEQIELLQRKLQMLNDDWEFARKERKTVRSQGKRIHITMQQEKSRLLGNLAWAYMQKQNYGRAEELYREALNIEPDINKKCNLAICLMHKGDFEQGKSLIESVMLGSSLPSGELAALPESCLKSLRRACEMLDKIEHQPSGDRIGEADELGFSIGGLQDEVDFLLLNSGTMATIYDKDGEAFNLKPHTLSSSSITNGFKAVNNVDEELAAVQNPALPPRTEAGLRPGLQCTASKRYLAFGFPTSVHHRDHERKLAIKMQCAPELNSRIPSEYADIFSEEVAPSRLQSSVNDGKLPGGLQNEVSDFGTRIENNGEYKFTRKFHSVTEIWNYSANYLAQTCEASPMKLPYSFNGDQDHRDHFSIFSPQGKLDFEDQNWSPNIQPALSVYIGAPETRHTKLAHKQHNDGVSSKGQASEMYTEFFHVEQQNVRGVIYRRVDKNKQIHNGCQDVSGKLQRFKLRMETFPDPKDTLITSPPETTARPVNWADSPACGPLTLEFADFPHRSSVRRSFSPHFVSCISD